MELRSIVAVFCNLFVLLGYAPAHAWGPTGHRTVGAIADNLLSDAAKAQVDLLMANDLDASGNPSGRKTLSDVAVWADEIRSTSANRPLWHFDDAPACGNIPDSASWCDGGNCASAKLKELSAVVGDASRPVRERNEALKWIVHLVGDVHQPLHATSNYYEAGLTDDQGNDHDRGGNDIAVALAGTKTRGAKNLHGVWDNDLVNLTFGRPVSNRKSLSDLDIGKLTRQAQAIPASKLVPDFVGWVTESNGLARTTAYHFSGFACYEPAEGIVVLSPAYQSNAEAVIHSQLTLAGARLAALLNSLLK